MFAFVSYAGGMCEFRLTQLAYGSIAVRHWIVEMSPAETGDMILDKSKPTQVYPDIFAAMAAIAQEIKP